MNPTDPASNATTLHAGTPEWSVLGMLSHDLRTPLNGALGFLDLLSDTPLTDEQRDYLDTAIQCAEELQDTLDGILNCIRANAGRLALVEESIDLAEFLSGTCRLFRRQAQMRGIGFELHLASGMPRRWRLDRVKLRQILSNLLANALKFTRRGEIRVEVEPIAPTFDRLPAGVRLAVRDSGVGIPAEEIERVFEPFHQVSRGALERSTGTGLGLAIVAQLAAAMGGSLKIESAKGEGTAVTLDFPWRQEDAP
jgi:signal transduction histidine kinase